MKKSKISLPPSLHKSREAQNLIDGATKPRAMDLYPWEEDGIDDTRRKETFNLRLTKRELVMLQCIGKQPEFTSQQDFVQKILLPAIKDAAEKIKKEGKRC